MHRRQRLIARVPLDLIQQFIGYRWRGEIRPDQKPRSCGWRERRRDCELGVVAPSVARIGLGPCEIKHELAVGVGLEERWSGSSQTLRITQCDVSRLPSCTRADAMANFKRCQKFVP